MATGPNSGVIEVVKDAKTVADVRILYTKIIQSCTYIYIQISGIRNVNKLLQWIKDHQKECVPLNSSYGG